MDKPDSILEELPTRLKKARKDQGLSLDAIANISGVSRSMVSQIERGESSPTIATLWNLTRALNVDFAGLLDQSSSENLMARFSKDFCELLVILLLYRCELQAPAALLHQQPAPKQNISSLCAKGVIDSPHMEVVLRPAGSLVRSGGVC